ncbi:MAG: L-aspartate oxidase [Phycisphaeraceae bacterium]
MHPVFEERRYLIPFRATLLSQIFTDVLVIGGGVAGMRAALAASEHSDVIITTKGQIEQTNTYWAQGGIACVLDETDSFAQHIRDTLVAGADLCDEPIVRRVVEGGPARIRELIDWGMRFDKARIESEEGPIALGREGGHCQPRILHADGDATGKELATTLLRQVKKKERVRLFTDCFVIDLITQEGPAGLSPLPSREGLGEGRTSASQTASFDSERSTLPPPLPKREGSQNPGPNNAGRCVGAITWHPKYGLQVIWAKATILASGGCGQVYRESTNPPLATGDGMAMAYRAGAVLADMSFVQFHPTTLYIAGASRSLITEAVRGEGAYLIDKTGHRFMPEIHELAELAPRDIVSRAILAQIGKTNHTHVYLDCRHLGTERFKQRFPGIFALLKKFDIDPGKEPIPIHPSAHYMVGGVLTDGEGRTNITGLYACGEAAANGLHGANRLASNSLLEGLVYGEITGRVCREVCGNGPTAPAKIISDIRPSERSELDLSDVRSSLRSVMWRHVGIVREGPRIAEVEEMFDFWARYTLDKIFDDITGWQIQNMLLTGALITRSARWRCESRGTHFRTDFPEQREEYRKHDLWQRGQSQPTLVDVNDAPAK